MAKILAAGVKRRKKPEPKPKLSDEERHKRFVAMAREVDADESISAFDHAFSRVVSAHTKTSKGP